MTDPSPIVIDRTSKRYESKDDPGRVVRVISRDLEKGGTTVRWWVEVVVNPTNPRTVGRTTSVKDSTIRRRYTELSH